MTLFFLDLSSLKWYFINHKVVKSSGPFIVIPHQFLLSFLKNPKSWPRSWKNHWEPFMNTQSVKISRKKATKFFMLEIKFDFRLILINLGWFPICNVSWPIHVNSPGYDTNPPVSRIGRHISSIKLTYFLPKFELSLIHSLVPRAFLREISSLTKITLPLQS